MFYTLLGGMAAVIWTDVIQVVIFVGGAFVAIAIIVLRIPGGPSQLFAVASDHAKFSLGSWRFDLITPTAWVVLLYGIMENLRNFGVDQNYVQRYLTTPTVKDSAKSVWTAALGYIPVSAFFLFIGTGLFAFYKLQPNLLDPKLQGELMGDKIFPFFITTQLPVGVRGILIAALLAAAMSTVSSSLNCVSTLTLLDFYKKYVNKDSDDRRDIQLLRWYTIIWGILGTITGLAMIKVKTALETGWQLGGIAGGGVIGLFLLGIMFKRTKVWQAVVAVIASVIAIAWATFARHLPEMLYLGKGICYAPFGKLFLGISLNVSWLECTWHTRMIGVIGTITLLVVGIMLSLVSKKKS